MPIKNNIFFINSDVNFFLKNKLYIIKVLKQIFFDNKKNFSNLFYIFCSDHFLHKMNVKILKHNTLTDVISLEYIEGNNTNGDIYISIDRVKDNAKIFRTTIYEELLRVIFHGTLHIVGFKDKTEYEKKIIHKMEDFYIKIFKSLNKK